MREGKHCGECGHTVSDEKTCRGCGADISGISVLTTSELIKKIKDNPRPKGKDTTDGIRTDFPGLRCGVCGEESLIVFDRKDYSYNVECTNCGIKMNLGGTEDEKEKGSEEKEKSSEETKETKGKEIKAKETKGKEKGSREEE